MRLKFVLNMERLLNSRPVNFIRVCWEKNVKSVKFLKSEKISNKVKEKDLYGEDHSSKMWKQVIASNVQEEKKNDLEDLKTKAEKIELKLVDMEDEAKKDHVIRKKELDEKIDGFKELFENFKTAFEEEKELDIQERQSEVDRTLIFMNALGKIIFYSIISHCLVPFLFR